MCSILCNSDIEHMVTELAKRVKVLFTVSAYCSSRRAEVKVPAMWAPAHTYTAFTI